MIVEEQNQPYKLIISSTKFLRRLHYFSGITLSMFIGVHLFNHLYSLMGIDAHIALMTTLRLIYRNFVIETILLIAVFLQIISGISLFLKRRHIATSGFERLQIWTGLYMATFLIIHLSAVFVGRLYLNLDTNFYFGAAGINTFPLNLFFVPYYALAVMSFFGHLSAIHAHRMKRNIAGFSPKQQSRVIIAAGFILTILLFYGLTNKFNGANIPGEYHILIGK